MEGTKEGMRPVLAVVPGNVSYLAIAGSCGSLRASGPFVCGRAISYAGW